VPFISWAIEYASAVLTVGMSKGAERLSSNARRICAVLLTSAPDPDPVQDPKIESAIEYAKRLGTYKELDRSRQYAGRYSNEVLKHDIDLLFEMKREQEKREFRHKLILGLVGLLNTLLLVAIVVLK
jgi:hypothetical protein